MEDQRSRRHLPLGLVAGSAALLLATGSAVAWWGWQAVSHKAPVPEAVEHAQVPSEQQKVPTAVPVPISTPKPPASKTPAAETRTLQVYWLKTSGSAIALSLSPVAIAAKAKQTATVSEAIEALLAGPSNTAITTTIPPETKLRNLTVKNDGIHIDLSKAFTQGGGSTSMTARVGQVLYTATSLNPSANVWLSVDGKLLETLGGEGLMLDQPLTRTSFKRDFPLQ